MCSVQYGVFTLTAVSAPPLRLGLPLSLFLLQWL